ncbi:MAG: hypothetical protein CVU56_21685 [Deltaproteobacteria bacterium HGW-Deltaproteobacteria-14]|nr:MAG: hypothetical protein CVU56_21685 [Deltaproteobacteria bacterium HGW-Deltaproteobacteria-14]
MRALLVAIALMGLAPITLTGCESETGCKDDFDCNGAMVCKISSGSCEALVCKVDADCGGGKSCDDNECK